MNMMSEKIKKESKAFTKNTRQCQKFQKVLSNLNTLRGRRGWFNGYVIAIWDMVCFGYLNKLFPGLFEKYLIFLVFNLMFVN